MEIGKKVYPEKIIWLFLRNAYIQIKKCLKKRKKWRLYNDCYTESDKKIAGPRFELGLSGLWAPRDHQTTPPCYMSRTILYNIVILVYIIYKPFGK